MRSRTIILAATGALALLALGGGAAFYSVTGDAGNGSCSAARATAERMKPQVKGEVAAVEIRSRPQPAPELAFTGPDGQPTTLAALKGKTLLVNLWATWCAPCLKEMPSLDALQKEMGGPDFAVVAINIDTRNLDKPKAWLAENKITTLPFYGDPQAAPGATCRPQGRGHAGQHHRRQGGLRARHHPGPGRLGERQLQGADEGGDREALSDLASRAGEVIGFRP
ncbi:Thiol-disulfide oxidoreductase ResA [Bosea thiooxidans]